MALEVGKLYRYRFENKLFPKEKRNSIEFTSAILYLSYLGPEEDIYLKDLILEEDGSAIVLYLGTARDSFELTYKFLNGEKIFHIKINVFHKQNDTLEELD